MDIFTIGTLEKEDYVTYYIFNQPIIWHDKKGRRKMCKLSSRTNRALWIDAYEQLDKNN